MLGAVDWAIIGEQVLQILGAVLIGTVIGYEREIKNKPAGLITFTLVCVGSCLIGILQRNLYYWTTDTVDRYPQYVEILKADQGRIIAQVVSGIGFLGAGAIIHTRNSVKGVTTAAMLWVVSGLGLLIGTGGVYNYIIAGFTAAIILPLSFLSRKLSDRLISTRKIHRVNIIFAEEHENELFEYFAKAGVVVRKTFFVTKGQKNQISVKEMFFYISIPAKKTFNDIVSEMAMLEYIYKIEDM